MKKMKPQVRIDELLADICHINKANKKEIKQIQDQLLLRVGELGLETGAAEAIILEVSKSLGKLSTKVNLVEKAISSINSKKSQNTSINTSNSNTGPNLQFTSSNLIGNTNLLPLESSVDGIPYLWSGADPEIQFAFQLERKNPLGMQLRLYALIKPEYSRQLKILVDGLHIKHRVNADGPLTVLSCKLPARGETGPTEIKIILPGTHSPMELGDSTDYRKLGIAISEVSFGSPEGWLSHLFKRLKRTA